MLLTGTSELVRAAVEGRALAGFSVYNLEGAQAIRMAAEETRVPVLMQVGASAFKHAGRDALASLGVREASAASAPIGVHLDHARDLDEIRACLELGYTSVMYDGSDLPFAENVDGTRRVVELARTYGAWVEGELGAIAGDEDRSVNVRPAAMTDPRQAAEFVALTGVAGLAVAVGNVHGFAPAGNRLDIDRLREIAAVCPVPLVLHGASGIKESVLIEAVECGVAKINVNTELRRAAIEAIAATLPQAQPEVDLACVLAAGRDAMAHRAADIARLLARTRVPPNSEER